MDKTLGELLISQYGVLLWQQACLSLNDRTTILGNSDQLDVIILLSQANGRQCNRTEAVRIADVLSQRYEARVMNSNGENPMNETILSADNSSTNADCCLTTIQLASLLASYDKYMLDYNVVDVNRVMLMVINAYKSNEQLQSLVMQQNKVSLHRYCSSEMEKRFVDIVSSAANSNIKSGAEGNEAVNVIGSDNDRCVAPGSPSVNHASPSRLSGENADLRTSTPRTPVAHSTRCDATLRVFYDYLSLIVNTRCQLSLARSINCPNRGIDHAAFTELKRFARSRNMPIYQMIVSYITRLRLGGQGYAPDPSSPLTNHVKGLSEFTDLMHKLLTIVEEGTNSLRAVSRVLTVLAGTLRRGGVTSASVDAAVKHVTCHATLCSHLLEATAGLSPAKVAKTGGTMGGLSTIRLLRLVVNIHAAASIHESHDQSSTSVLHSPAQPSVVTLFTSPEEEVKREEQPAPLRQRVAASLSMHKSNAGDPSLRKSSVVRHFSTTGQLTENCSKPLISDFMPCKTLVTSGGGCKRPTSSADDKENIAPPNVHTLQPQQSKKVKVAGGKGLSTSKKTKGKAPGKTSVLSHGQKQLTAFFR